MSRRGVLQTACALAALPAPGRIAAAADPSDTESLDIRRFGAVGNGVADDTEAFVALHGHMRAQQDRFPRRQFVVELTPGHYRYRWNRWMWGIRRITVRGHGATIQCISASVFNLDKYALVTNRDFFETANEHQAPGRSQRAGHAIATARPGDRSVTLKSAADAREYRIEQHVLILSYDQQFYGYPPNCRYFDFARVAGVDAGRIRLDRPLRNLHRDDYPDPGVGDAAAYGPARLLAIDHADVPLALEQRLEGLTTLPNPNREGSAHHVAAIGVLDFAARDCTFVSFIASCGDKFSLTRTTIEDAEPDKLVNTISFSDCRIGTITEATGVNSVRFRNCDFLGPVQQEARHVTYEACSFRASLSPGRHQYGIHLRGFAPTRTLRILGCAFHGRNEPTGTAVSANPLIGLRITAPVRLRDGGRTIEMPFADEAARHFLKTLEPGDVVLVDSGREDEPACDGRYGVIETISADHRTVRLGTAFSSPVGEGDRLWVPRVRRIVAQGNVLHSIGAPPPWALSTEWGDRVRPDGTHHWTLASDGPADTVRVVAAVPTRVTIDVVRPYRGPEASAYLRLLSRYPTFDNIHLAVNCRRAGRRIIDTSAVVGAQPGDDLRPLPAGDFVWTLKLQFAPGARANEAPLPGIPDRQAHCLVELATRSILGT